MKEIARQVKSVTKQMFGNQKMTRDEIMVLSPRELDALVAKYIEGLPVVWGPDPYRVPDRRLTDHHVWINGTLNGRHYDWEPVKRYASDWSATKRVIEAMSRHGLGLHLCSGMSPSNSPGTGLVYYADFRPLESLDWGNLSEHGMQGEDVPLVVVRAALWALAESAKSNL